MQIRCLSRVLDISTYFHLKHHCGKEVGHFAFSVSKQKTHDYPPCFSEDFFGLSNSVDLNKMPHYVAFHLDSHCLPKYPFRGFQSIKG